MYGIVTIFSVFNCSTLLLKILSDVLFVLLAVLFVCLGIRLVVMAYRLLVVLWLKQFTEITTML